MKRLCVLLFLIVAPTLAAEIESRGAAPRVPFAFEPLPPGAVQPRGWLRDWAVSARDGITGHLDEYHPTFGMGWKGQGFEAPGGLPDGTGWPLEQCAYWLDGAIRLGLVLHDKALTARAAARLDAIVSGTLARDGTLIWWKDRPVVEPSAPKGPFNNWAHSHIARALLAYYEGTGDPRILQALVTAYRDFPLPDPIPTWRSTYGVVNVDPLLEIYRLTGERRLLEAALAFASRPAFRQTFEGAWAAERIRCGTGHGVLFAEQARVPALLYPWTGERWMLEASLDCFAWAERTHMLPCGVPSSEEYLAGVGAFRCIETCDVPAWIWSKAALLRITGQGGEADAIERAFFNAGPAPIARDWKTMCYYQSPNRISAALPGDPPANPRGSAGEANNLTFTRLGYDNVLCCVGNVNRVIPYYIQNMWMKTPDGGLAATLYGPCEAKLGIPPSGEFSGTNVSIKCETAYPFEETIRIAVDPERPADFPLYLRVPDWCARPQIKTGLFFHSAKPGANGFVKIERKWKKGDAIELRLPMAVRVERGAETPYPNLQYFSREASKQPLYGSPYAAVHYGPLLFALPIPDVDANTPKRGASWNYALDFDGSAPAHSMKLKRAAIPASWDWPLEGPLALEVPARGFDWKPTDAQPLPAHPVEAAAAPATIRLVPYGCTRFRVSMFPVTARAWGGR